MILKTCKKCDIKQDYINFVYINSKKEDILGQVCNDCKIKTKKAYKSNKVSNQTNEYWRKYRFNRRKKDSLFNFKDKTRSLLYNSIIKRKGYSKKSKTQEILGCSFEFFFNYIEKQFKDGMTWDNIHLDHIKPLVLATTEEEVLKLNHYTNFQPLFAIDNLKKGSKY